MAPAIDPRTAWGLVLFLAPLIVFTEEVRVRRLSGVVLCVAAATALGGGAVAGAVAVPKIAVVLPAAHSVAGVRLGDPASVLTARIGAADEIANFRGGTSSVFFWFASGHTARVVAIFDTAAQDKVASLYYADPVKTARGDRTGTRLAVFRRHWPAASRARPIRALPGAALVSVAGTAFVFDGRNRLSGVLIGTEKAASFVKPNG